MFTQVITEEQALREIDAYFDKKKVFPKRRESIKTAIEAVAEAMTYGFVIINEDGSITQKLVEPIGDLSEIKYAFRVTPIEMDNVLKAAKTVVAVNLAYLKTHSGLLEGKLKQLENGDRTTADCLAFFFQF